MTRRRFWVFAIAVVAAGLVLAAVLVLGGQLSTGGGGHGDVSFAGLFGHGGPYEAPPGQPPATDLRVDRLRDAFNSVAKEPRIILSLSPT